MITLVQLTYFKQIVEAGSITAAARVIGVRQPTLSVAIQRLEEGLKTQLLERTGRGVAPTSTGQVLYDEACGIIDRVHLAERRILGLETDDVGQFTLGCYDSLGAYFLPGFMPQFMQEFPQIDLSLWTGPSDDVLQQVVDRQVDFGLIVNPRQHPELVLIELFDDAVALFASSAASTVEQAKARVRAQPLLLAARVGQSHTLLSQLIALGAEPARVLACGEMELVKSLCMSGVGVGVLPRRVAAYGQSGRLVHLHPELPIIPDRISLVYRSDRHRTQAARRVKDMLVEYGRTLMGDSTQPPC